MINRRKELDNRERYNFGIVAAAVLNSAMGDPNREPTLPVDFVPDWKDAATRDLTKMTPMQQKYYWLNLFSKRRFG